MVMQIIAQKEYNFFPNYIDCHTGLRRCFVMAALDYEKATASEPTFSVFMENLGLLFFTQQVISALIERIYCS